MGITFLFYWGTAIYTVRKVTDALFTISFCYTLLGITIWAGRAMRFYNQSEHFTSIMKVSPNDRPDLSPAQRRWVLLISENRALIAWTLAGLVPMLLALLVGLALTVQFPPDTVLRFLVRPDLPPQLAPGVLPGR